MPPSDETGSGLKIILTPFLFLWYYKTMKNKSLVSLVLFLAFGLAASYASAQNTSQSGRPTIRQLEVEPRAVCPGQTAVIKWNIEPGPGVSRITNVRINAFQQTLYNGSEAKWQKEFGIPYNAAAPSSQKIEVKITSSNGKTTTEYVGLRIISLDMVKRSLILEKEDKPVSAANKASASPVLRLKVSNSSGIKLSNVKARIVVSKDPYLKGASVIAELPSVSLNPGTNILQFNLNSSVKPAAGGTYLTLLYGSSVPMRELVRFPLDLDSK